MSGAFPLQRLGNIAESIDYGLTASATAENTGIKFLRITDIQEGLVDWSSVPFCDAPENKLRSTALSDGDIVFARTGATTGKSFLVKNPPPRSVFASYLIRVRPHQSVDSSFLAHFFQSTAYWRQIKIKTRGAAQGGVNATSLSSLEIPIPPFDKQRRIAAILDKADALRRKRERALEMFDSLIDSLFMSMFGDPCAAKSRWDLANFSESCSDRTADGGKIQKSEYASSGLFPVVDQGQKFIAGWSNKEDQLRSIASPVIVFGDHTRIVKYVDFDFIVGADGAKVLHPTDKFDPLFFAELMRRMPIPDLGYSRHMRSLKELYFPCPPRKLQNRFSKFVVEILDRKSEARSGLEKLDDLFTSLQDAAFSARI